MSVKPAPSQGDHGLKSYHLKAGEDSFGIRFSFDEALALYVGRRLLDPLAGTLLWEAAQNAFRKVKASLGNHALSYLDKLASSVHSTAVGAGDYRQKSAVLDALMQGMEERKTVLMAYQSLSATESVTHEVCPYAVVFHRYSLYLVAESRDHNEVRHYKVDRIGNAEVSPFPFHRPDDFDVGRHLADSFGVFKGTAAKAIQVRVRFATTVARYVLESRWHASQTLNKRRDGSVVATFQLSSTEEIKRWIMSFGASAEALEPESLRDEIRSELMELVSRYSTSTPRRTKQTPRPK